MGIYETSKPKKVKRLYRTWSGMRTRCNNPTSEHYERYGGRGIKICDEWDSFDTFEKWAYENGYREDLSIERINNDLGYSPDNCRWATAMEQANNRSSSVKVTYNGETHTIAEWARISGVDYMVLIGRFYKGYSFDKCLSKDHLLKKSTKFYEYDGKPYTIAELSKISGISHKVIYDRLSRGWTVEDAITIDVSHGNKSRHFRK